MSAPSTATECVDVIHRHIVKTPGVMTGRARVDGTRIRVMDIVGYREQGMTPEEIAKDFTDYLTLADVYAALAYYEDNRDEIERDFHEADAHAQEFLEAHPDVIVTALDD